LRVALEPGSAALSRPHHVNLSSCGRKVMMSGSGLIRQAKNLAMMEASAADPDNTVLLLIYEIRHGGLGAYR